MIRMTLSEYLRKPKDYRGEWTTERWDIPNWEEEREKYMGKRTLMTNIDGATCLVVDGLSFEFIDAIKIGSFSECAGIALKQGKMIESFIDEINEISVEEIGDILIEETDAGFAIVDCYIDMI